MTAEEMASRIIETEQRSKSNTHRISKLEESHDALNKLTTAVSVMAVNQEHLTEKVDDVNNTVTNLAAKPGKRWESLVDKLLWTAGSGLVGYFLARMGLG